MKDFMSKLIVKLIEIAKEVIKFFFSTHQEKVEIPVDIDVDSIEKEVTPEIDIKEETYEESISEDIESIEDSVTSLPEEDTKHHEIEDTEFTEDDMFFFFIHSGMTYCGASGLMGNLYAESGLKSNNLQNSYNKKFDMTDEQYTIAVDSGDYHNFVGDSAGYGLAQWTFWTRKQNLLNYAVETSRSIGDCRMQCEFLIKELQESYRSVWRILCTATTIREASNAVLLEFERPHDQSESVQIKRIEFGERYYYKYCDLL